MAKFQGNKGPWSIDKGWLNGHVSIDAKDHGALAQVVAEMEWQGDEFEKTPSNPVYARYLKENEFLMANARLMAAAPQLLDALETALEWIDAVPDETPLPAMPGFDRDEVNDLINTIKGV